MLSKTRITLIRGGTSLSTVLIAAFVAWESVSVWPIRGRGKESDRPHLSQLESLEASVTIACGSRIHENLGRIGEVLSVGGPFAGLKQVCHGALPENICRG